MMNRIAPIAGLLATAALLFGFKYLQSWMFRSVESPYPKNTVHGFNVSLEQAIARATQMAEDMLFHGVVAAFSWQSVGETGGYSRDEQIAERAFCYHGLLR